MTPEQTSIVTKCHIEGKSIYEIAPLVNRDPSTVARTLKKPDIRAQVEAGINRLIQRGLKPAVNTMCRFAALGNTKDITGNPDLARLSLQASDKILSHVSGSGPQTVINQLIYSQGAHSQLGDESLRLLDRVLGVLPSESQAADVIDLGCVDSSVDR